MNIDKIGILCQTDEQIKMKNKFIEKVYEFIYLSYRIKLEKKAGNGCN